MTTKCKFRFHRNTLKESLGTLIEIANKKELCEIISQQHNIPINEDDISISYYAKDTRLNEDSYIVTVKNLGVVGFTNTNLL